MPKVVLFLCTGNYYRSRFAEILFNHHAVLRGVDWVADSRALAIELGGCNVGPISVFTRLAIESRGLPTPDLNRFPIGCELPDLESADLVVAVKEAEHRKYLEQKFAGWSDRVTYWHVHDLDAATPDIALSQLERHVLELLDGLDTKRDS